MIHLEHVTKTYHTRSGPKHVLRDVSLTIPDRCGLAILGPNGAGKSTLLRMIGGVEYPTSGRIRREGRVSWPLGFVGGFQGSLTGADNTRFIARIYGKNVADVLSFVDDFAELGSYMRMPVKTYSSGMQARLTFAISLAIDFDCYLVDEITSVGDKRFRERCHAALMARRQQGSLIMVSHDLATLSAYCDSALLVDNGVLIPYESLTAAMDAYHEKLVAVETVQ